MQWIVTLEKILMLGRNEGQGEWDERGWDVWMASRIQCTWVSASSGCWWWTRSPGVLQSMGFKQWGITEQMKWTDCFGRMLWTQVLNVSQNGTENYISSKWKIRTVLSQLCVCVSCVCVCVCVCVMGNKVGMVEQTAWWSSLTGRDSCCSELILRRSC